MVTTVKKTWKPTVPGILDIISGLLLLFFCLVGVAYFQGCTSMRVEDALWCFGASFIFLILAVIAIKGGLHALSRKKWRWALAGSICSVIGALGILSVILIALSKDEFK